MALEAHLSSEQHRVQSEEVSYKTRFCLCSCLNAGVLLTISYTFMRLFSFIILILSEVLVAVENILVKVLCRCTICNLARVSIQICMCFCVQYYKSCTETLFITTMIWLDLDANMHLFSLIFSSSPTISFLVIGCLTGKPWSRSWPLTFTLQSRIL